MNILKTFLKLTKRTYPHGTESDLFHLLPKDIETDEFGNKFIQIGKSNTMFASHLDTATSVNTAVTHVFDNTDGKSIVKTDGKSILGADDKAGVTIMFYMIHNKVPGLYYFFLGEEVGCVGSKKLAGKLKTDKIENINKVISFDRRGYDSVITHQFSQRCCSDEFGTALSEQLNKLIDGFKYENDPSGLYTDSAQFTSIYPECTNISVGYKSEHTSSEQQDITHLEKLAEACLKVDWENLPISRDPSKVEYRSYSYGNYSGGYYGGGAWGEDDWDDYYYSAPVKKLPETEKKYFIDNKFRYITTIELKLVTNKLVSLDIAKERLQEEEEIIFEFLTSLEVEYSSIDWDGMRLKVYYENHMTTHDRADLVDFLPELDFWKEELKKQWDSEGVETFA